MERLFSPCTRMRDRLDYEGRLGIFEEYPESLQEINLDVSTEELRSAERAFTYADLYAMLRNENTIAWLTPLAWLTSHGVVERAGGLGRRYSGVGRDEDYSFSCDANGKAIYAAASSSEELLEICDVVCRLLAASVVHSVEMFHWRCPVDVSINATGLAYLMEQCQSLKALRLQNVRFLDVDQICVLGAYSRPDLEIILVHCKVTSAGASALAEVLGRNQGPTKLDCCDIDNSVIADGLRGNSRLKSLSLRFSSRFEGGNPQALAIASDLRENKGLVDLDLSYCVLSDETWDAVCDSLKTHPSLEVLRLWSIYGAPAAIASRIQALLDMMKVNMSIYTIHFDSYYHGDEIFRESVIPYFETNRLRPRVRAIQKTRPIAYRAKVLGRALLATRTNPNRFWMLLSGNPEVAFPSTATTTPAANVPTPATTGTTSTAAAIAATVAVTVTANLADSATDFSVAKSVATPTVYQKLKARP